MKAKPSYEELEQRIKTLEKEAAEQKTLEKALRESELRTEAALRENEIIFSSFLEHSPVYIFFKDKDIRSLRLSKNYEQMLGMPIQDALGKSMNELFPSALAESMVADDRKILEQGEVVHVVEELGGRVYETTKFPIFKDGVPNMLAGFTLDITDQKRAEEALRKNEELLRIQFEHSPDIILIVDRDFKFVTINRIASGAYTREDLIGRDAISVLPESARAPIRKAVSTCFQKGEIQEIEHEISGHRWVRARMVPIISNGQINYIMVISTDITERKRAEAERQKLEEQLRQAYKMEAVGKLAGGIAHEFNNLLYLISGNVELLLMDDHPGDMEKLTAIFQSTQLGAGLVKQLLAFSRKSEINAKTLHLNFELLRITKMLEQIISRMIAIELDLAADLYTIHADPMQLEQVLINLTLNAGDAMPDGGTIRITTENGFHGDKPWVILTVSDTGCGMEPATVERIFDPFFTTKQIGKGTGLGLAVVYGIIQSYSGRITCRSEVGSGTTFTIHLPGIEGTPEPISTPVTAVPLPTGTETVLVVDDEEMIITLTKDILKRLGYQVLTAKSGEEALAEYQRSKDRIDLIILDLGMPGMGGQKCLEKLLELNPAVRIIVASGYAGEGLVQDTIKKGARNYLIKPYRIELISEMVRNVLDE